MKILLVDDSKSARYALRLQLQRHDVEVETADSAEAAFEILERELPDAILMDHMMPGLNGFEALEILKQNPRTASIPVVMCSSHEEADFVETARRKGVLGVLPKSVAPERMPEILEQLRATLAQPTASPAEPATAPPPQPAPAPTTPPPTASATTLDGAELDARIAAQITRTLTPMLEDLRRDLSEQLRAEVRQQLDTRQDISEAELQAQIRAILPEQLPNQLRIELEGERARVEELIDASRPQPEALSNLVEQALQSHLKPLSEQTAQQAIVAARHEIQEQSEMIAEQAQASVGANLEPLHAKLREVRLWALSAAFVGIAAAGVVWLLLGGTA
ncbi:response regulator [Marichromatium bheemlicum]|uniref:Response regulator n=1 Tax=Marichromatium bheemlicum TaxID=365339 RepID=A0ABX1I7W0_9GAMM|nr:response regulator [Marichromatium bheemlicum]NKN33602.1 response regulator [Marichromatium bheemlicum]